MGTPLSNRCKEDVSYLRYIVEDHFSLQLIEFTMKYLRVRSDYYENLESIESFEVFLDVELVSTSDNDMIFKWNDYDG